MNCFYCKNILLQTKKYVNSYECNHCPKQVIYTRNYDKSFSLIFINYEISNYSNENYYYLMLDMLDKKSNIFSQKDPYAANFCIKSFDYLLDINPFNFQEKIQILIAFQ